MLWSCHYNQKIPIMFTLMSKYLIFNEYIRQFLFVFFKMCMFVCVYVVYVWIVSCMFCVWWGTIIIIITSFDIFWDPMLNQSSFGYFYHLCPFKDVWSLPKQIIFFSSAETENWTFPKSIQFVYCKFILGQKKYICFHFLFCLLSKQILMHISYKQI